MREMKPEDKVRYVIDNITKGRDLDVIAIELGYKNYKSLDMFMRREGYCMEVICRKMSKENTRK